jgi:hypothetical protein
MAFRHYLLPADTVNSVQILKVARLSVVITKPLTMNPCHTLLIELKVVRLSVVITKPLTMNPCHALLIALKVVRLSVVVEWPSGVPIVTTFASVMIEGESISGVIAMDDSMLLTEAVVNHTAVGAAELAGTQALESITVPLAIRANTLAPGMKYKIKLTAALPSHRKFAIDVQAATVEIVLTMASGASGNVAVFPTSARALTEEVTLSAQGTVRVFRQKFTLEDALGSHASSLEASRRVTNGIPLGCPRFLPVHAVYCVQTLKGGPMQTALPP